MFQQMVLTIGL